MLTDGWRLSLGTLTAVPVRPPHQIGPGVARTGMVLAPLAALPLAAGPLVAHGLVTGIGMPALLAAALTVAAIALGCRGLHLDGLADLCDGLAASYERERALEVMRRGDVGPAGVAAVALVLILQVSALAALVVSWPGAVAAAVAVVAGRHTLAWSCRQGVPAARPEGLGATVAGTVPTAQAALAFGVVAGLAAIAVWSAGGASGAGVTACAAAVVTSLVVVHRARRRLGGVTGDVLGGIVELGTTAALVGAVLTVSR